ncbi:hypothetical protein CBS101457_004448 [Exobasidium rhododendri]|nr:hypothetical protein CBS101457_004448 [Exobasidium rhododendri]
MQYVGRLVSSVYNTITPNINAATLSGAIDVIVVERQIEVEVEEEDEYGGEKKRKTIKTTELASTPFHVRFGKMSVLRPAERKVTLHLNNSSEPLPFAMKVGEAGEAFFVLELGDDEARGGIPEDLVTSPIVSAVASPIPAAEEQISSDEDQRFDGKPQAGDTSLDDDHRAPRKFIAEDYVEPLDLGSARATTNQYLKSDLENKGPASGGKGDEAGNQKERNTDLDLASGAAQESKDVEKDIKDEEIASKVITRKEDMQYMLDMDGYKMTSDGEELAFAEGNRFSDELPLSRRHGGLGQQGHREVLSKPHEHTAEQMRNHQKQGAKGTLVRRGSFGDSQGKPSMLEKEGHKRRGSHSAAGSDAGSFEAGNLSPLLHYGEEASKDTNDKERDTLNLSRDLVRLTRSLRPSHTADDEDGKDTSASSSKWRDVHRQQTSDHILDDFESGDVNRGKAGSAAMEMSRSTHSRHQRATSEEPATSRFGDESPPIVRDDAALGRSSEYDWGWGKMPRKDGGSSSHAAARRQRVLSNPEVPEEGSIEANSRSNLGQLVCDHEDPYKFRLELDDASHTFELSLCYVEGLEHDITGSDPNTNLAQNPEPQAEQDGPREDWADHFEENQVSYQRFLDDEGLVNDERLVIRYNGKLLTWENASAVLATLSLYRKTLGMTLEKGQHSSIDHSAPVDVSHEDQRGGGVWRRWWNRSKETGNEERRMSSDQSKTVFKDLPRPLDRANTDSILDAKAAHEAAEEAKRKAEDAQHPKGEEPQKTYAKTLRLTSDQLKSLNLRKGANTITFSVTSSYSGVATCSARIFLWEGSHQIVVSDIDGTITKSDALGHVFTMIGRDWTHLGVAKLYTDIARNGYRIMYLTSRPVGQSDATRAYLKGISQNNYKLPDGPVIMSPDRMMASFHREVILRKPEVFKMACLRDIARLFGADPRQAVLPPPQKDDHSSSSIEIQQDSLVNAPATLPTIPKAKSKPSTGTIQQYTTPFYAGFGNRITDALSYRSVNVPSSRIFTIDSNGEVQMELLELAGYKSSYIHMTDLVDQMFPPITLKSARGNEGKLEFNDFNYWRPEIASVEFPSDEELMPTMSSPASPALSARSVKSSASVKSGGGGGGGSKIYRDDSTHSLISEEATSRLSRFGLGKLGLSRKSSAQSVAATEDTKKAPSSNNGSTSDLPSTAGSNSSSQLNTTINSSSNDGNKSVYNRNDQNSIDMGPSSPSSYGSGVSSWAAGWRRRAASPGPTSPLVGPVITADAEEEDSSADENDDVSSFGEEDDDTDQQDQNSNLGEEGEEEEDDDDPLLATGEIQFEWLG